MKRFTWWRMEQNAPHNAWERWCPSCSILHHVKRFISQSPTARASIVSVPYVGEPKSPGGAFWIFYSYGGLLRGVPFWDFSGGPPLCPCMISSLLLVQFCHLSDHPIRGPVNNTRSIFFDFWTLTQIDFYQPRSGRSYWGVGSEEEEEEGDDFCFWRYSFASKVLTITISLTLLVILINSYKKIEQLNFQLFPIIFIAVVACKIEWHCNLRVHVIWFLRIWFKRVFFCPVLDFTKN